MELFDSIARHYADEASWDIKTVYLYCCIVIIAGLLGWLAQRPKPWIIYRHSNPNSQRFHIKPFYFYGVFIVLVLFSGLRAVGTDYTVYQDFFNSSTSAYAKDFGIEPLFLLLNKILKSIGLNYKIAFFIFSFLTIYFVFLSIRQYSDKLSIALALLAYTTLYYFQSFNLVRMYMAASFTLYAYHKYFIPQKTKKFFIVLTLICLIHYSAILFFLPTIGVVIFQKSSKWFWIVYTVGFIVAFMVLSLLPNFHLIERYEQYATMGATNNNFGMMHWIINIPIIVLYLYAHKKLPDHPLLGSLLVLTMCEFLIGLLSYRVMMLGRSLVYYNVLFVIIIPSIIHQLSVQQVKWSKLISCIYTFYLFGRFYMYLTEYLYRDGLMPYKTILCMS